MYMCITGDMYVHVHVITGDMYVHVHVHCIILSTFPGGSSPRSQFTDHHFPPHSSVHAEHGSQSLRTLPGLLEPGQEGKNSHRHQCMMSEGCRSVSGL